MARRTTLNRLFPAVAVVVFVGALATVPALAERTDVPFVGTLSGATLSVSQTILVQQGTGVWHVVSGTGRFSGASGLGTAEGTADPTAETFVLTIVVKITY